MHECGNACKISCKVTTDVCNKTENCSNGLDGLQGYACYGGRLGWRAARSKTRIYKASGHAAPYTKQWATSNTRQQTLHTQSSGIWLHAPESNV
eukprot:74244-Pelagomonas_calceolata.AAC.6